MIIVTFLQKKKKREATKCDEKALSPWGLNISITKQNYV